LILTSKKIKKLIKNKKIQILKNKNPNSKTGSKHPLSTASSEGRGLSHPEPEENLFSSRSQVAVKTPKWPHNLYITEEILEHKHNFLYP
jgi:hypothetical protein